VGKCHLHLGSNQGDRQVNIARALQMIEAEIGPITGSSALYETAAWGKTDQDAFINIAIEVEHYESPKNLLNIVNKIEDKLGRVRAMKWGPRLIDIDIILMEDIVVDSKRLTIPHALMHKRNFVLAPMAEVAPDVVHPVLEKSMIELYEACEDDSEVIRIPLY